MGFNLRPSTQPARGRCQQSGRDTPGGCCDDGLHRGAVIRDTRGGPRSVPAALGHTMFRGSLHEEKLFTVLGLLVLLAVLLVGTVIAHILLIRVTTPDTFDDYRADSTTNSLR
jgi:hypothetical protein